MGREWPALPYESWRDTCATLHRYLQIVGKIRIARTPLENHWWNAGLQVGVRGISTGPIPYADGLFEIEFDFLVHQVVVRTSKGGARSLGLLSRPVARFYGELFRILREMGIEVAIDDRPCEIAEEAIPFSEDMLHRTYDRHAAQRWLRIVQRCAEVLERFRCRWLGKKSPVLFYWGSFDLAASLFSGRPAPEREGADAVTREAYSHEVASWGVWPGTDELGGPFCYAYFAPSPPGFEAARIRPEEARWSPELGEYLLPWEAVRRAPDPAAVLLAFLESTWEAGTALAGWDRVAFERGAEGAGRIATATAEPPPPAG